ncbi:MAG: preprotein translocase subunit SecG [Paludibacteraceae bacterium]|nr:preprotein translocase subunit SecG [Paludibacteraceae bacterium]MBQ2189516.1 preprotein translocase subunit SecG [Paludibacteraceae bacterium]MBQ2520248.1 preprotein translocase subunit SecG [Paludibacteraceae bacterium]MBQ4018465.1 preprotein translocase subunit SecG [Paludibacteraceae bacterium]
MYIFITVLIFLAAILLTLLVLVQNSKGGGLAAGFSSGNQVMGAPKTADFLEKATWTLLAVIVALSIVAVGVTKSNQAPKEDAPVVTTVVPASDDAPATPVAPEE